MIDFEKTLRDLCLPLCDHPESLSVKTMNSINDRELLLCVYADDKDIASLIGRKGTVAGSLRSMMGVAARDEHKRLVVNFEAY